MLPTFTKSSTQPGFGFDYQDTKRLYKLYSEYSDEEFLSDLPNILHFACFVAWFKGLDAHNVLSDYGIIHELAHLLCSKEPTQHLDRVRQTFDDELAVI